MPWRSRAASCLMRLDEDPGRARDLAEEELGLARAFGAPRARGRALRITGRVAGDLECLREAVDVLERAQPGSPDAGGGPGLCG